MGTDEQLETVLANASRLADSVIANCDDWAEGRAYAYALRESLRLLNTSRKFTQEST